MLKRREILDMLWLVDSEQKKFDIDGGNVGNYSPQLTQAINIRDRLQGGEGIEDVEIPVVQEPCFCFCHQYPENVKLKDGVCEVCGHKNEDGTLTRPDGKCWFENL